MSLNLGGGVLWLALGGACALFVLDLVLSAALLSVNSLSRVAVRRLSRESAGRLAFVDELKTAQSTQRMATQVSRQMSLLGGTVLLGVAARAAGLPHPWLFGVAGGTALGVLLLETLLARALAQRDPRTLLRAVAPALRLVHALTWPVLAPFATLTRRAAAHRHGENGEREEDQDEELDALIEVGEREGILEEDEGKMMRGVADLADTRVREIMVPRTDIVAFPAGAGLGAVREAVARATHSRFPVYRETIDNVVGILHARDLLGAGEGGETTPITSLVRPAHFVPETRLVSEVLAEMRQRTHMALVVDEYGGIAGLVTLEDILEEIVGDIRDEHDREEAEVQPQADGSWLVSGMVHVEQIEELFGLEVGEREFDTVGGLVVAAAGRVPAQDEVLEIHGLRIQVVRADRRRVYQVRLRKAEGSRGAEARP